MHISYMTCETPTPEQLAEVDRILDEFNHTDGPIDEVRRLCVFAKGEGDTVVGGAVGRTWGECCELQQLSVEASHRGRRVGANLMEQFEAEARARGCRLVYLDTLSFQAPEFYKKCGYHVAHEMRGFTHGVIKYTMHKSLFAA